MKATVNKIFSFKETLRLKRNFTSLTSVFFLSIVMQIALVPLMIWTWGLENYGIWIFFLSIPATLSLLNVNFIKPVRQEIIILSKKGNLHFINQLFINSFIFTLFNISFFLFIYIIFNIFFFEDFQISENLEIKNYLFLITTIGVGYSLNLISSNIEIGIASQGRIDVGNSIKIYSWAIMNICIVVSGFLSSNINIVGFFYLFFNFIIFILFLFYLKKYNKKIIWKFDLINLKVIKKIFYFSNSYYLSAVSYILKTTALITIIGYFFNAETVVLVNTIRTLFFFAPFQFSLIFSRLFEFEYANKFSKKKFNEMIELFKLNLIVICIFTFLYFLISLFFGNYIYNIWTDNKFIFNKYLILIVVFDAIFLILTQLALSIPIAINKFFNISVIELFLSLITFLIILMLGVLEYEYINFLATSSLFSFFLLLFSIYFCFITLKNIIK